MTAAPSGDNLDRLSSVARGGGLSPIHGLATDVVAEILACLDSSSLSSAVLAHPLFWATFRAYQQRILREILARLIPPQLLHLASATYEADSIDYSDWNLVRGLLDRLNSQPLASSPVPCRLPLWPLTRRAVAAMERVHYRVQYFTTDFVRQAIPRFSRIFEITRPETSTISEELRIFRAFYRFQLYCNIFGRKAIENARHAVRGSEDAWRRQRLPDKSDEDMQCELEWFFWPWPPWANEQLACVFEYLETKISVFFDEVASHDVEWGWRQVDWVEPTVANPHRRFLLLNGLQLPYQLSQSDGFETWKMLLDAADIYRNWHHDERVATMADSLRGSAPPRIVKHPDDTFSRLLGKYDTNLLRSLMGQTAWTGIDDAATLPVKLWMHAHYNNVLRFAVFSRTNLLLREAGYVFWDGNVGETGEILAQMETCSWTFSDGRLLPHELPGLRHAMRRSWRKRSQIWLEGGRGYWADGDESRVRYEYL